MKDPDVQKKLNQPASKRRRSFIGGMASLGAGLAGSVILPTAAIAQPTPEAPPKTKSTTSGCGRSTVIASDAATVAETTAGKIRGFKRNGVYVFKGVPYGASQLARDASCRQSSPNPGREYATRCNTDACARTRTLRT